MNMTIPRAIVTALITLFVLFLIGPGVLVVPVTLLTGWVPALIRYVGTWRGSLPTLFWFSLAGFALIAGTQGFLAWLQRSSSGVTIGSVPPRWRWKWTLSGFGMLGCTLLAIASLVLTTHQVYWISKSNDPLVTDPFHEHVRAVAVALGLQKIAEEAEWNTVQTRVAFWRKQGFTAGEPAMEIIQPVWIEQNQQLRAIVLVPRRPLLRRTANLAVLQPGTNVISRRLEELPDVLRSFGISMNNPGSPE